MIPFLLAAALSCPEAQDLIDSAKKARDLDDQSKEELVQVIKANASKECWDANA